MTKCTFLFPFVFLSLPLAGCGGGGGHATLDGGNSVSPFSTYRGALLPTGGANNPCPFELYGRDLYREVRFSPEPGGALFPDGSPEAVILTGLDELQGQPFRGTAGYEYAMDGVPVVDAEFQIIDRDLPDSFVSKTPCRSIRETVYTSITQLRPREGQMYLSRNYWESCEQADGSLLLCDYSYQGLMTAS